MRYLHFTLIMMAVFVLNGCASWYGNEAQELKVLAIGNSFSRSLETFLPQVTASVPGKKLKFCNLYIGGCTLERHWDNVDKSSQNPDFKPYTARILYSHRAPEKHFPSSINSIVTADKWDIITIQQGSRHSFDYKNYQPYADNLIKFLKQAAPQAEIVIQQTWAYRSDSNSLRRWNITQKSMYNGLDDAYRKLAGKHKLRLIPVGYAVELYRNYTPKKFQPVPSEVLKSYQYPQLPSSAGDAVGSFIWRNDKKTAKRYLASDTIHLNYAGKYMQSCIWFASLFRRPVSDIKFVPPQIDTAELELLKKCADEAVRTYPQFQ